MGEVKRVYRGLGIEVRTIGITLDPKHIKSAEYNEIDELIVGSIQRHYRQAKFSRQYHLIFDYIGALMYDGNPFGHTVLPIYYKLLLSGGAAIFVDFTVFAYKDPLEKIRERDEIIRNQGFNIKASQNGIFFVKKL